MSSSSLSSDETSVKALSKGKSGKKPAMGMTMVMVVFGTWIGVASAGGVLYLLVKSGKIPVGVAGASAGGTEARATRSVTLEPILANLADEGGHAYVRLGLRVEIEGGPTAKDGAGEAPATATEGAATAKGAPAGAGTGGGELESSIRDTVLAVLGRQTSANLLGPDGKEHLKIELRDAIERGSVRVDVKDVFFTDFLVQI